MVLNKTVGYFPVIKKLVERKKGGGRSYEKTCVRIGFIKSYACPGFHLG